MRFTIFTLCTLALIATSSVKSSPWRASGSVSTYGNHESVSGGDDCIQWDDKAKAPCNYDNNGHLKRVRDHGCPMRTRLPKGYNGGKGGSYGCDHKGGNNSLIGLDLLNCGSLCLLSEGKCATAKNCQVKGGDNQLIGVTALDCTPVKLLSADGP